MSDTSPVPGDGPTERERIADTARLVDRLLTDEYGDENWRELGSTLRIATAIERHLAARTPAPSEAQALRDGDAAARVLALLKSALCDCGHKILEHGSGCESCQIEGRPVAHPQGPRWRLCTRSYGWFVLQVRDALTEGDRLDVAPTDPGTRRVEIDVYDQEPGPEVTEVESLYDGGTWERDEWGWSGPSESDLTWESAARNYGPMLSIHSLVLLRTPGTEETGR